MNTERAKPQDGGSVRSRRRPCRSLSKPETAKASTTVDDLAHGARRLRVATPRVIWTVGLCKTVLGRLVTLVSYCVGRVDGVSVREILNHAVMTCNDP
jgi:hypothetical protein